MDSWMGPFVVKAGRRLDQFTRNGVKVMGRVFTPRVIYTAVACLDRRSDQSVLKWNKGLNQAVHASGIACISDGLENILCPYRASS